jgi:hypothetical protein
MVGQNALVFGLLLLLALDAVALDGVELAATLETEGGDETLDLGTRWRVKWRDREEQKEGTYALV